MSGNHDFIHLSLPSPSHLRTHNDLSLNCELSPENRYNLGKDILCITSHWSEWPSSKSLQTRNAGEGVEKREPSCPIGGDINCTRIRRRKVNVKVFCSKLLHINWRRKWQPTPVFLPRKFHLQRSLAG